MALQSIRRSRSDAQPTDQRESETSRSRQAREDAGPVTRSTLFRLGRGLFGGVLAFMAIDNLRDLDARVGYAESKGAPVPSLTVPAVSVTLLLGSLGVVLWRLPSLAAGAVATFFVSVTPVMHDFWQLDDPDERQQQLIHFLKNTALLGAALALFRIGRRDGK